MGQKEDIVILGGGFVGLVLARKLVQAGVVGGSCEVTVIDKSSSHTYTPWLYEVSSGYLSRNDGRRGRCKLYTSASVPFIGIPGYRHVRFRHEAITGVDFQSKTVFLADGLTVRYSILVIALGTEASFFGIPGLAENACPLKSATDAVEIERRVREVLAEATPFNKKHINVVGAGPTGVEFAGELMTAIHNLEARGELVNGSVDVSLIDRKGPLSSFVKRVQTITANRLSKLGVHLMPGLSVMSANDKTLTLKDASGNNISKPSDLTIWSGGVTPVAILKTLNLPMDPKGRILVDDKFAVKGVENVYCAGDAASLPNPISKEAEPIRSELGRWKY